jgi:hypothetical protein
VITSEYLEMKNVMMVTIKTGMDAAVLAQLKEIISAQAGV